MSQDAVGNVLAAIGYEVEAPESPMSWVQNERPRYAWLTNAGELILFEELHSEVRQALRAEGIDIDPWPLAVAMRAIHRTAEELLDGAGRAPGALDALPTPEELCELVDRELRRQRTLLTRTVIRSILAAYLSQLRRLDIARVHYF